MASVEENWHTSSNSGDSDIATCRCSLQDASAISRSRDRNAHRETFRDQDIVSGMNCHR